jgi:hypothetical protein
VVVARFQIPKVPKFQSKQFRSWTFVVLAAGALTALAVLDRGGLGDLTMTANGNTGCQMEVTAEVVNVRSGPSEGATVVETLRPGRPVDATRVVTDGFRELEGGRWAAERFLTPVPGTTCS